MDVTPEVEDGPANELGLRALREHFGQRLDKNEEDTAHWNKLQEEYVSLGERLKTLPDEVSYDIMVPIGSKAFMPGQMVHTNEILVLLGDNWLVERSAKQAGEICQRRIEYCDQHLKKLADEKSMIESWLEQTERVREEVTSEGDIVEIREEYDEEQEEIWKEQHAQRVKEYRRKLAEERNAEDQKSGLKIKTFDELLERVNHLEMVEEMEDELACKDSDDSDDSEIIEENEEEEESSPVPQRKSRVSFADVNEVHQDDRCLEAGDSSPPATIYINFSHSDAVSAPSNQDSSETTSKINSPSDIYTNYIQTSGSKPLKSILKPPRKVEPADIEAQPEPRRVVQTNAPEVQAFSDVVEKTPTASEPKPIPEHRPVSRFRAARIASKR